MREAYVYVVNMLKHLSYHLWSTLLDPGLVTRFGIQAEERVCEFVQA